MIKPCWQQSFNTFKFKICWWRAPPFPSWIQIASHPALIFVSSMFTISYGCVTAVLNCCLCQLSISLTWLLHFKSIQLMKLEWLLLWSNPRKHNAFVTRVDANKDHKTSLDWNLKDYSFNMQDPFNLDKESFVAQKGTWIVQFHLYFLININFR